MKVEYTNPKAGELIIGKTYYTKSGDGRIIPFVCCTESDTKDVYLDGFLSRHISDIAKTIGDAATRKNGKHYLI